MKHHSKLLALALTLILSLGLIGSASAAGTKTAVDFPDYDAAAWYAQQGKTLLDAIEALYREFGYYRNALCSFAFEGESGMHTMQELMKKLRANAPEDIAGYKVESVVDYDTDGTGLPRANVLEYHLDGGHKLMVRPSGTEPKIKVYLSAVGDSEAAADAVNAALAKAAADMMKV